MKPLAAQFASGFALRAWGSAFSFDPTRRPHKTTDKSLIRDAEFTEVFFLIPSEILTTRCSGS